MKTCLNPQHDLIIILELVQASVKFALVSFQGPLQHLLKRKSEQQQQIISRDSVLMFFGSHNMFLVVTLNPFFPMHVSLLTQIVFRYPLELALVDGS